MKCKLSFIRNSFITLLLILFTHNTYAFTSSMARFFYQKSACFLLFDLKNERLVEQYDGHRCAKRIAADSTFKVALSLMAFDKHIINQNTVFKWDGKEKGLKLWDHDQSPHSWLKNSVVWVSQQITPQLGLETIQQYLHLLDYGNQDFSGDPGKHNGLKQAWLSSSLKISANEQLRLLQQLLTEQLPVSKQAMQQTKENMYLETSKRGWHLYGKSGSGHNAKQLAEGWFIGFTQKDNKVFLFVTNFTENNKPTLPEVGGNVAKSITKNILERVGVW